MTEKMNNLDNYTIICWPEIQEYMDKEGFEENSSLITNDLLVDLYGSSAYFVSITWINNYKKSRYESNMELLSKLKKYLKDNPDIRFVQALFNLNYIKVDYNGQIIDTYNEEPSETLKNSR